MRKYGIFSWFSYGLPIKKRLELIKEAGFDAVTLWWGEKGRMKQPDMARKMGLIVENVHAPFLRANSIWEDNQAGDRYLDSLLGCIKECSELSVPVLVVHITDFGDEPEISDVGLDRLKKLVEFAGNKRINIALENTCFLQPLKHAFDNIDSENLGFCYDCGHENFGTPYVDWLSLFGNRLLTVHLDDNFGDSDAHLLPFDGKADWERITESLKKCRHTEFLSLEVDFNKKLPESHIYNDLDAGDYLKLAYTRLKNIGESIS